MLAKVRGSITPRASGSCADKRIGDSGLKEYELRGAKPKAQGMSGAAGDWHKIQDCFRVYFPSRETVLSSKGGKDVRRIRELLRSSP